MLAYFFQDTDIALSDLAEAVKICFDKWKQRYEKPDTIAGENKPFLPPGRDPETYVLVHQGGGLRHLNAFLHQVPGAGYRCHEFGTGLYVTPLLNRKITVTDLNHFELMEKVQDSRSPAYACRTPLQHFDTPALFYAVIKVKYLIATNRSYEAVLPAENIRHIQRCHVEVYESLDISQLPLAMTEFVATEFKEANADLILQLEASINRVTQRIKADMQGLVF